MTDEYEVTMSISTDGPRAELVAHGYRVSGSVHLAVETASRVLAECPDQARTTLLAAATETLLTAPAGRGSRPLPSRFTDPSEHPEGDLGERREVTWLEPLPDALVDPDGAAGAAGPDLSLARMAALQHLSPVDRALVSLADHSRLRLDDVAAVLGCGPETVAAELACAHAQLARFGDPVPAVRVAPEQAAVLLESWAAAFAAYDVAAIRGLLTEDAVWEMPPYAAWFRGAAMIERLIRFACPAEGPGDQVMVPVRANGQPGFALYMRDPATAEHRAFQIQVLTLTAAGVAQAVAFFDVTLFDAFGLPQLLSDLRDSQPPPVQVGGGERSRG